MYRKKLTQVPSLILFSLEMVFTGWECLACFNFTFPVAVRITTDLDSVEGYKLPQFLAAMSASLLSLCVGMALGWTSAASCVEKGSCLNFDLGKENWSWVVASVALGAVAGSLPAGFLLDFFGRRLAILSLAPVMFAGWSFVTWANAVWMLCVGRVLLGIATGAACIVVPIFICEIAHKNVRGHLGSYFELMMCVGILVVYTLGTYISEDVFWLNIACMVMIPVFAISFLWFPDTPRWLLSQNRDEDAKRSLRFYRGELYDIDAELMEVLETLRRDKEITNNSFLKEFGTRATVKGLLISSSLMVFQQLTGINVVIFYASQIFDESLKSSKLAQVSSAVVGTVQIGSTLISSILVDRFGRRPLLLISSSFMTFFNFSTGIYFLCDEYFKLDVTKVHWIPLVTISLFVFFFSLGFGPIPWLYSGELFPDRIKGIASSIANIINWLCAFAVTKYFVSLGYYTAFFIFAAIGVVACVFIPTVLLETSGKTLDEIIAELEEKKQES